MRRGSVVVGVAMLVALALHVPAASACMGSNVLLQDNFQTMAANWGEASDEQFVQNGSFIIKPHVNIEHTTLNKGNVFTDMDACVDLVVASAGPQLMHNYAGLAFWAVDTNNDYEFLVSPQGTFAIYREVAGRWITVTDWAKNPAIKPGLNQVNTLRIVTKGNQATFYVGGTQLATITGQPPQGGGEIGLVGASGAKTQSVWQFSKLKVTD